MHPQDHTTLGPYIPRTIHPPGTCTPRTIHPTTIHPQDHTLSWPCYPGTIPQRRRPYLPESQKWAVRILLECFFFILVSSNVNVTNGYCTTDSSVNAFDCTFNVVTFMAPLHHPGPKIMTQYVETNAISWPGQKNWGTIECMHWLVFLMKLNSCISEETGRMAEVRSRWAGVSFNVLFAKFAEM